VTNTKPEQEEIPKDPLVRIALELHQLTREFRHDSWRDRKLVYFIVAGFVIGIATVGVNLWHLVENMNNRMTEMADDMDVMRVYMASMHEDMGVMSTDMNSMRADMSTMSRVMGTMETMGPDVHRMTSSVDAMAMNVGAMTQSVGLMSTMTPAVQRMSVDTNSMGRDMHWMMPFNWIPGQ
jgi:hypothetical protein